METPLLFLFIVFLLPDELRSWVKFARPEVRYILEVAAAYINFVLVKLRVGKLMEIELSLDSKDKAIDDHAMYVVLFYAILIDNRDVGSA